MSADRVRVVRFRVLPAVGQNEPNDLKARRSARTSQGTGAQIIRAQASQNCIHAVSTAGWAISALDWRSVSGGSFVRDDLAQFVDAVLGEGWHPVLADAVDPEAAI